jgi:YD repeat-containing protein
MNSGRCTFALTSRLIPLFIVLLFLAPHTRAQQDDTSSSAQSAVPGAPGKVRQQSGQRPVTPGGNRPNSGNAGQRGSSPNAPRRRGPSTDATNEPSTPENAPARPRPSGRPGGRGGSSTDAADKPSAPVNSPRGPRPLVRPSGSGDSSSEAADKPSDPINTPGRPRPSGLPGRRGGAPTDATDDRGSSNNRPPRRGLSTTNPAIQPSQSTNADDKGASGNDRPRGTRGGYSRTTRANGTVIERDNNGRPTSVTTPRGTTANMDGRGRVTTIRDKSGNTISRGPRGERKVETVRADRTRVVSIGRRGGYVERPFDRGGRQYMRRTYVMGGRTYASVYRGYHYHGRPYYWYVPPFYYAPAYYHWIYSPWPRPIYYRWGWYGSLWYRPYHYYFSPFPVYPYASLWLTDYLIAENLRLAYESDVAQAHQLDNNQAAISLAAYHPDVQADGAQSGGDSAVLSPKVKQMIADEVKAVIADEQNASSSSSGFSQGSAGDELPAALDPNHRVFVVFSVLDLTVDGETCSLTSSDVVKRTEDTPLDDNTVAVQILASKQSDCAIGSAARIQLSDLNDMQNHLHEQVDAGIKILAEKQGKDGLPTAPAANPRPVPEGTASPDVTAAADLQKQEQEADRTEKEVQQEAASDSGANN